jgi:hypothetical protein
MHVCLGMESLSKCHKTARFLVQSMHMKQIIRELYNLFLKYSNTQIGTDVSFRVFNAGLPARSQFTSRSPCDWPTQSRLSVIFLLSKANAKFVPKFHVSLHASHPYLPKLASKFHFNAALPTLIMLSLCLIN